MDDIIDDLYRSVHRCERAAKPFKEGPLASMRQQLTFAINCLGRAWSGSWIGYQARVYKADLHPARPGEYFDSEMGLYAHFGESVGDWREFDYETIRQEILRHAGDPNLQLITEAALESDRTFQECKAEILATFDALVSDGVDSAIREQRAKLTDMTSHFSESDFVHAMAPKVIVSRDQRATQEGRHTPPHLRVQAWLASQLSHGQKIHELAEIANQARLYLQKVKKMKGQTVTKTHGPIFIGHGRSALWKDLKDFLVDRLKLEYEEFNRKPVAGLSTKERVLDMLDRCCFAFLVLTGEDEVENGTVRARQNVVHEVGVFQGRYGWERAIIVLEEGCDEFSNIHGVGQIRFPKGNLAAGFEEIRRVLEREGILPTP